MQLASSGSIPDGLLATIALRNENSRLGVPSSEAALHLGHDRSKSEIVLGIEAADSTTRARSSDTGKERDTESGNDYFGARYYASSMGRFMSPDEPFIGQHVDDPQSWNLYSYGLNNPVSNTDDDGHDVSVCTNDANGSQHCTEMTNAQYQAAQQAGNGGLNVPTLDQVGTNGSGNITDANGNTVGTATYISDGPLDPYTNASGYALLGAASNVVNTAGSIEVGIMAPWAGALAGCTSGDSKGACAANLAISVLPEVGELKAGAKLLQEAAAAGKKGAEILEKTGGALQAAKDFEALKGAEQINGATRIKTLSDGTKVVLYDSTGGSGARTIAIQHAGGGVTKIRYP